MRENIKKFFSYLGFNDTTINEKQILILIYLLGREENIVIKPKNNLQDLINQILIIYIDHLETNSFVNLTEYDIVKELSNSF